MGTCSLHSLLIEVINMQVKSPKAFNQRIYSLIKDAMDLKGDLTVSPQDESIEVSLVHSQFGGMACFAQWAVACQQADLLLSCISQKMYFSVLINACLVCTPVCRGLDALLSRLSCVLKC